jgi:hypothetical protein
VTRIRTRKFYIDRVRRESRAQVWFQTQKINASAGDVGRAVQAAARHNPFHPVRHRFKSGARWWLSVDAVEATENVTQFYPCCKRVAFPDKGRRTHDHDTRRDSQVANRYCNRVGARVVDAVQRIERRIG